MRTFITLSIASLALISVVHASPTYLFARGEYSGAVAGESSKDTISQLGKGEEGFLVGDTRDQTGLAVANDDGFLSDDADGADDGGESIGKDGSKDVPEAPDEVIGKSKGTIKAKAEDIGECQDGKAGETKGSDGVPQNGVEDKGISVKDSADNLKKSPEDGQGGQDGKAGDKSSEDGIDTEDTIGEAKDSKEDDNAVKGDSNIGSDK